MNRIEQTKNRDFAINLNWIKCTIVEQEQNVNYNKDTAPFLLRMNTINRQFFFFEKIFIYFLTDKSKTYAFNSLVLDLVKKIVEVSSF